MCGFYILSPYERMTMRLGLDWLLERRRSLLISLDEENRRSTLEYRIPTFTYLEPKEKEPDHMDNSLVYSRKKSLKQELKRIEERINYIRRALGDFY